MKYQPFLQWLVVSALAFATLASNADPIPDRYNSAFPKIGYFGRMEKVLYSSNATDTTIATNMIIDKIFGLMGMESDVKFYEDANNLKNDLSKNLVDGVFVNIFDYFAMEHLINPDYIYALTLGPEIFEKTLLITHKNLQISKLEDLSGRSITIPSGHHLGKKYLDLELMKRGLSKSEHFFSTTREVVDINSAIIDLFFGKTDCALVTDIAFKLASELNKQIPKSLDVLLTSNQMIPQIIALNKNISKITVEKVDHNIVNAHKSQHVKHLLSLFRAKKIIKLKKNQLDENRRLLVKYQTLDNNRSSQVAK
jgi:ABC-type phosphate/phosphonate transport system substrate-binding protein